MCAVNRVSGDPPMHRDCAEYAVKVCPFMVQPKMVRRSGDDRPAVEEVMGGTMIERNPGVALLWVAHKKQYSIERVHNGWLFRLKEPKALSWWCQGRPATRAEVIHSLATGMPILEKIAREESPAAEKALLKQRDKTEGLLPA
jgi:hypothetical protein